VVCREEFCYFFVGFGLGLELLGFGPRDWVSYNPFGKKN